MYDDEDEDEFGHTHDESSVWGLVRHLQQHLTDTRSSPRVFAFLSERTAAMLPEAYEEFKALGEGDRFHRHLLAYLHSRQGGTRPCDAVMVGLVDVDLLRKHLSAGFGGFTTASMASMALVHGHEAAFKTTLTHLKTMLGWGRTLCDQALRARPNSLRQVVPRALDWGVEPATFVDYLTGHDWLTGSTADMISEIHELGDPRISPRLLPVLVARAAELEQALNGSEYLPMNDRWVTTRKAEDCRLLVNRISNRAALKEAAAQPTTIMPAP